ncbi:unnamed protein product [Mytilus edulis]|uniref:Endonuclease/exonuclease/phosphatase domain-containing protein n=1 Tax=Mytilus edulis TaxID=6550 RepID=A0A8S3QCX8_MYTED|nr:unnamed protein product [Mytilus edulis]
MSRKLEKYIEKQHQYPDGFQYKTPILVSDSNGFTLRNACKEKVFPLESWCKSGATTEVLVDLIKSRIQKTPTRHNLPLVRNLGKSEDTWTCPSCSKPNNSSTKVYFIPSGDDSKHTSLNISTNPLLLDSISDSSIPSTSGSKSKKKGKLLEAIIESTDPDIIIGTDTWLDPNIKSSEIFPDYFQYDIERRDRPKDTHGGVLIAAKQSLQQLRNITKSGERTINRRLQPTRHKLARKTITHRQYPIRTSQACLDTVADYGLERIVDFQTRKENILDLILTSYPSFKLRCKPLPQIANSDHDIVLLDIAYIDMHQYLTTNDSRTRGKNTTDAFGQSFLPRTIREWNQLPTSATSADTVDGFRASEACSAKN